MFEWLRRRPPEQGLPEYAALRAIPTRGLPAALVALESSQDHQRHCEALHEHLRQPPHRPNAGDPFLVSFAPEAGDVLTMPRPDGSHSLLVFSSPFRARDYARTHLAKQPAVQYRLSSAAECAAMLNDLRGAGLGSITLDRCPRCDVVVTFKTPPTVAASDVLSIWSIGKGTQLARTELYLGFAREAARSGSSDVARDMALEAIGHVTMEDARLHLLLGKLGLALGDRALLRDAQSFLEYFRVNNWQHQLREPM